VPLQENPLIILYKNMLPNDQTTNEKNLQNDLLTEDNITIIPAWVQRRVSTKDQVGKKVKGIFEEKASLGEQEKNCRRAIDEYRSRCPKCSKEIRMIFTGMSTASGESGQNFEREDIEEFIRLAEEGKFKVLVTNDNDRMSRSLATGGMIREKLKKRGIQVYSLSQPVPLKCPDCFDYYDNDSGMIVDTISDLKSQLDISKIRRNYKIGMPRRIEKGKPAGSLPYGLMRKYRVIGKDINGSEIIETYYEWDPEKTAIVKRIADDYLDGLGVWGICRDLNNEGVSSPQGKKWGRSAIMVILKNPAYNGKVRFGWKTTKNGKRTIQPEEKWIVHKAEYDPIWEDETYYKKIQDEIERRRYVGGRTILSRALLIGLLKCSYCGKSMYQTKTRRIFMNGVKYLFRGYACGSFMHGGTCCSNGKKQKIVDDLVINEVLKLTNDKTRKAYLDKVNHSKFDQRKELYETKDKEFKRRMDEFKRVKQAYKEGVDTLLEYKKNKEEMLPILGRLQKEVSSLQDQASTPIVKINWDKRYESMLSKFVISHFDEDTKSIRKILFRLIDKIEFKSNPLYVKILYKTASNATALPR
jgi:DNA invertase Pin-like site-specific DNA recombinase